MGVLDPVFCNGVYTQDTPPRRSVPGGGACRHRPVRQDLGFRREVHTAGYAGIFIEPEYLSSILVRLIFSAPFGPTFRCLIRREPPMHLRNVLPQGLRIIQLGSLDSVFPYVVNTQDLPDTRCPRRRRLSNRSGFKIATLRAAKALSPEFRYRIRRNLFMFLRYCLR